MSFMHDNPVLVAPRPIRLTAAHHSIFNRPSTARLLSPSVDRIVDRTPEIDEPNRISADPSPRASPRSALPSEALEEFLSILRPSMSFFPPTSPLRRTTHPMPNFHYERPSFPFRPRPLIEQSSAMKMDGDDPDGSRSGQPSRNALSSSPIIPAAASESDGPIDNEPFLDGDGSYFRWFTSGVLSSPVSRMHTRNPFFRQGTAQSPPVAPLSPAAIPLPTPTPEEMLALH